MRSFVLASLFATVATVFAGTACLMKSSDCTFDSTCVGMSAPDGSGSSGDGGPNDAEGGAVKEPPIPVGCDVNADAKDSLPCAVTSFALFVNANAPEGGDGSKEKPFRAIQAAIDGVRQSGKHRIYICGTATYAEHLEMTAATYAHLLGGFDCGSWEAVAQKPSVAPAEAGFALHIDAVPSEVRVEDVAFAAVAGTTASPSSIAVFVASSPNVLFKRAEIKANAGADGSDGVGGKSGVPMPANLDGSPATGPAGGLAKTCTCDTGGTSVGGKGGNSNDGATDGTQGLPAIVPPSPATSTGEGQLSSACNTGGVGPKDGSNGNNGDNATPPGTGALDASGWHPGDGASGKSGSPGQGGGGGGARTVGTSTQTGGGGGGACGGCAGGAGTGGSAGGSSIAILSFSSTISFRGGRLETATGGKGGAGKAGASGGSGGGKGTGGGSLACQGAGGGSGGNGGSGAGGAGGASVGILYSGPVPNLMEGAVITKGGKGSGGLGGTPTVNDGPAGLEGDTAAAP